MRERIASADTFFIATGHHGEGEAASFGMDASHRGGTRGFVHVEGDRRLVFPDYAGNNHFNTIGNLVVDGRAGLLFVDYETGGLLQLTGHATIDWDSPAVAEHDGAKRLIVFELDEAIELSEALPLRWTSDEHSLRTLRLVEKRRESEDVTSFVFSARDGGPLPDFEPGQHLPIELEVPGFDEPVRRTYSLSNEPGGGAYRISVKREPLGTASRHLHDVLEEGACVSTRTPAGDFVLAPGARPIVLVSAGVGVTPMLSMLRDVVARDDSRHVVFVHVARDGRHHAFREETRALALAGEQIETYFFYSRPEERDERGRDFDHAGRLDAECLSQLLPAREADIYLCGPVGFMAEIQQGLETGDVRSERIHSESFGPRG
jgi:ferredoxin-NADP reductase